MQNLSEGPDKGNNKVVVKRSELSNYVDSDGMPILVNAVMSNSTVLVGLLLLAGANPNAEDNLHCSVLQHACLRKNPEIVALLIRLGARFDIESNIGVSIEKLSTEILGDPNRFVCTEKDKGNKFDDIHGIGGLDDLSMYPESHFNFEDNDNAFDRSMNSLDDTQPSQFVNQNSSKNVPFKPIQRSASWNTIPVVYRTPTSESSNASQDSQRTHYVPFKHKEITLETSLEEAQQQLHSACCAGDQSEVMKILQLPPPPLWLRNLERNGIESIAVIRRRNSTNEKMQIDEIDPQKKTTSSSSSSSNATEQPKKVLSQPEKRPFTGGQLRTKQKKSEDYDYSDDDDDDDENDLDFEIQDTKKTKGSDTKVTSTIDGQQLETMITEQCDDISMFFDSFTPEIAEMVLRRFEWDLDLTKVGDLMDKGYDEDRFRQEAGALTINASKPKALSSQETVACVICTEEKRASEFLSLGCKHWGCQDCWRTYLNSKAATGLATESLFAPCMGHNKYSPCGLIVPESFFAQHSSSEAYKLYRKMREEDFVRNFKKRVLGYCPGPDCGRICAAPPGATSQSVIDTCLQVVCSCPLKSFCMGCVKLGNEIQKGVSHAPATCQNVSDWQKKTTEEGRYFTFRVKHCPMKTCRATIVKCGCQGKIICNSLDHCPNQACNHMHCKNCGTHFCWICGNVWADHNNYYQCNKELSKDLTPTEFFKGCLERYDDHMKSYRLCISRIDLSLKMYEHFRLKFSTAVQGDVFTESNTEMMKSYNILAYSYVRRHYISFAHDAERNLYEMQQGMLENYTNQLIGKYEIFKKWFEGSVLDIATIDQDLVQMREFSRLLQGFRKNIVESFSTWALSGPGAIK